MSETVTIPFNREPITISTGKLAKQAQGSVVVRQGETVLLVTVGVAKPREGTDFFPLTVEYEERMYAAGKISGSKFLKREGRPSEEAILKGRVIDRSVRPMFPKSFRSEVQLIVTTLAYDDINDPVPMAVIGASAALLQTKTPFAGPIAAVRVAEIDGEFVANPTLEQLNNSPLDLLASGSANKITMIEVAANEVSDERVEQALIFAQEQLASAVEAQRSIQSFNTNEDYQEPEYLSTIGEFVATEINSAVTAKSKDERDSILTDLKAKAAENFGDQFSETEINEAVEGKFLKATRSLILNDAQRPDGRAMDEIRPLNAEVDLLPRVHGSALFDRGETQCLTITTLGGPGMEQWVDTMEEFSKKRYMHHYNFPPYSVGEVKRMGGMNRREIGHGALAEKALLPVLPAKEDFPYTIRLVSEILGSNGSSSMAATCGSTLSLMAAGVPLKKPVAGIAMGLVSESDDKFQVLTDLQGLEDFAGEMDFKVAGTADGVTAVQLDVKNQGLTQEMIATTLRDAKSARLKVLEVMQGAIPEPRSELAATAPRIITTKIAPDKIGELIGPGGKNINGIIDRFGGSDVVSIDIEEDGTVLITSPDSAVANEVKAIVESIGKPIEVGQEFSGEVTGIVKDKNSGKEIGAIVALGPTRDGMIHISALGNGKFVNSVSEIVSVGDTVKVRVKEVDNERGRISLTKID